MKKLIALLMVCMMLLGSAALAAEWPEGRSPSKPFAGKPEIDLESSPGYIVLYPRTNLSAKYFCDEVRMYLPREDVKLGEGFVHVYENVPGASEPVEIAAIDVTDSACASIEPLPEEMMTALMWGSGVSVNFHLPKSLEFGDADHSYFVLMDEGCVVFAGGKVVNPRISNPEAWTPVVEGDYGVSGLCYTAAPTIAAVDEPDVAPEEDINVFGGEMPAEGEEAEDDEELEEFDTPAVPAGAEEAEEGDVEAEEIRVTPQIGDHVNFDLVLGGKAVSAVLFSNNDSVNFDQVEYIASASVTGTVIREDVSWGIVFLDEAGEPINAFDMSR